MLLLCDDQVNGTYIASALQSLTCWHLQDLIKQNQSDDTNHQTELQALRDRLTAQDSALVATRREAALDKLGLPAKYRAFSPQVDPSTVEGAKALEAFPREHPELLSSSTSQPQSLLGRAIAAGESNLAKVLKGERKSTLVTEASIARLR